MGKSSWVLAKLFSFTAVLFGLVLYSPQAVADPIFRVTAGSTQQINKFNYCRRVTNSGTYDLMVPTGTYQEWFSFLTASGLTGISLAQCPEMILSITTGANATTVIFYAISALSVYDGTNTYTAAMNGQVSRLIPANTTIQYAITGQTRFNGNPNNNVSMELKQWGTSPLFYQIFYNIRSRLTQFAITATDAPNLSGTTTLQNMFSGITFSPLSNTFPALNWSTSHITNMATMFQNSNFNQGVNFNTAAVTNFDGMFALNSAFNQPVSFNAASAVSLAGMFNAATAFNSPLALTNTGNVTTLECLLCGATVFNQPLTLNTANVTNMYMMFTTAAAFNQPLAFNTAKVTNMNLMFANATSFNQDLSAWVITLVTPKPPTNFRTGATSWTLPRPSTW